MPQRRLTRHDRQSNPSLRRPLSPVREGPGFFEVDGAGESSKVESWGHRLKGRLLRRTTSAPAVQRSHRTMLDVLGAPLAPVHVSGMCQPLISIPDSPMETSFAQYILQKYTAASGGQKLNSIQSAYAMGKLKMFAYDLDTPTELTGDRNCSKVAESGGFVLWQMNPDMWYVEIAIGGIRVHAGCNGELVWRHTPWLGANAGKGHVRPLRRAVQGLDPRTTASMFIHARYTGEKNISGEDCFSLEVCVDPQTLKARSNGPNEIISHVLSGYFSQRTGLLVYLEDSHSTCFQSNGGDVVYWETIIHSFLDDYRSIDGIMIAHSGRSVATLLKLGETSVSHTKMKVEEEWTIEDVAFDVPGLSRECFIPPAELSKRRG